MFPDSIIHRIDRDTVKNYEELESALNHVEHADILIGTQMISKGHNFSNVALVGIIGIDTMLNFPDFRSSERMFQLLTQMAGRAVEIYQVPMFIFKHFSPTTMFFHLFNLMMCPVFAAGTSIS